jgi:hypothetical protein
MGNRGRSSFTKRLKERSRQEKQREKAEKKVQRKLEKGTVPDDGSALIEDYSAVEEQLALPNSGADE